MSDLDALLTDIDENSAMTPDGTCETLEMWLNSTPTFQGSDVANFSVNLVNFTRLRNPKFSVPVYGYVTPLLLIITFFTNSIVVAVLSRPHMRSPTNFILCVMALSDLLTLGIPVPMFVYQYTLRYHSEPVPCYLAYLNILMTDILPTICHSASVWMTVLLAFQRYIYVCHPARARTWCTVPRVTYATICLYSMAILYNIPRLFDTSYRTMVLPWKCRYVDHCHAFQHTWSNEVYMPVFYWFRVLCVNCIPCVLLVFLNTLLVLSLNEAQANRKRLFSDRKQESSKQRDSTCTTMMLVAVVCVFLIVEFPLACIVLLVIIQNTWELELLDMTLMTSLITFSNLCIGLSYIIYFPIYCSMSRQFRETFKELFIKAKQLSHETVRNGRSTTQRKNLHLALPGAGETYLTQADEVECTKTDQISRANMDEDETAEAAKETETLL